MENVTLGQRVPANHNEYLEHVNYEVLQLIGCISELRPERSPELSPVVQNALLESLLMHIRNLAQFLDNEPRKKDMYAGDFVPSWTKPHCVSADDLDRIHRQVAHLTYDRFPEGHPNKRWEIEKLVTPLLGALRDFSQRVGGATLQIHAVTTALVTATRGGGGGEITRVFQSLIK